MEASNHDLKSEGFSGLGSLRETRGVALASVADLDVLEGAYAAGDGHPRHCDWLYNVVYWLLVYCIISNIASYWHIILYHIKTYHITSFMYCITCII